MHESYHCTVGYETCCVHALLSPTSPTFECVVLRFAWLWTRTVQDFQRSRPKSCLMWQLADGRLARHDGTFPPLGSPAEVRESPTSNLGATRSEEDDPNEGDMTAQLIWHHDVRQQTWPQTKQPSFCNR